MYWSRRAPAKNLALLPTGPPTDYITGCFPWTPNQHASLGILYELSVA